MLLLIPSPRRAFVCAGLSIALLLQAAPDRVSAQSSIEDLERKIQAAKEARSRREAESARAAGERKAQEARLANLVVQTDAPCTLSVNGKDATPLPKGITEVKVTAGQKLISCVSGEEKVSFEGQLEARSGQDTVLRISLAGKVDDLRRNRREAAEKAERDRREALESAERERRNAAAMAACKRGGTLLMPDSGDSETLLACIAGTLWRSDIGTDIGDVDWDDAQDVCSGMGDGWSLPSVAQMKPLYRKDLPGVSCLGRPCNVRDWLGLKASSLWSSQTDGSKYAHVVNIYSGEVHSFQTDYKSPGVGVICVSRP
jgi:hypothetical protein